MTESDSSTSISNNLKEKRRWRNLIYIVSVLLTFALLTIQISVRKSSYSLKIGDVTTQDILAPRTVTYKS
jgi:membrane-associated HD superfamily phosphohydrolase